MMGIALLHPSYALTAEQNFRLLQEIEANRSFLLTVYQQNPQLLKCADARIKQLLEILHPTRGMKMIVGRVSTRQVGLKPDLRPIDYWQ